MECGYEISVLDHGYVKLVDHMGRDEDIVEAARMSTGRGFVSWEPYVRCKQCDHAIVLFTGHAVCPECQGTWQEFPRGDLGMLEFMYKNAHLSPFEFCSLHIEVQAPIMVFREWHRHRTQKFSEFSARYSQMPDLHYIPALERIQKQSAINRQSSGDSVDVGCAESFVNMLRAEQEGGYSHYNMWVNIDGIAKEIARLNTPVSRYSKMRAKTDLRNWLGFLQLRLASNAQYEIREYAQAVAHIVKDLWPKTFALFEEHTLHGVHLSRSEAAVARSIIDVNKVADVNFDARQSLAKKLGL